YTLPIWKPKLRNTVFLCIFRDPATTAISILKEIKNEAYLRSIHLTFAQAVHVWTVMYQHVVEKLRHEGDWLFLHYNQMLASDGLDRLETFVEAPVDRSFPEASLHRSFLDQSV